MTKEPEYPAHKGLLMADGLQKLVMPYSPYLNVLTQPLIDEWKSLLVANTAKDACIRDLVEALEKCSIVRDCWEVTAIARTALQRAAEQINNKEE